MAEKSCVPTFIALMREVIWTSKTEVSFCDTTRRTVPEDRHLAVKAMHIRSCHRMCTTRHTCYEADLARGEERTKHESFNQHSKMIELKRTSSRFHCKDAVHIHQKLSEH
jgi:hypothetical protein